MRNVWIGSVAALTLACTVGIGAQTTASPAPSSNQASQDTVTVTGCLKPADPTGGATGTSGSTTAGSTAGSSSDRFMLANATAGAATTPSAGSPGTSGSTAGTTPGTPRAGAASSSSATGSSYVLDGDASELRRHVNHQVEIKGRLAPAAAATGTPATGSTATPPAPASREAHPNAGTLRVESVKMLAATCPAP